MQSPQKLAVAIQGLIQQRVVELSFAAGFALCTLRVCPFAQREYSFRPK